MNEQKDLIKRFGEGKLSRRDFIKLALASGASVAGITSVLSACAPEPTAAPEAPAPEAPAPEAPAAEEPAAPMQLSGELSMKLRAAFIPQGNEVLKAIIEDWGAKNGVKVNVDIVSMNDLQTITATAAETGAGPDIVEINQGSAHLFADQHSWMSPTYATTWATAMAAGMILRRKHVSWMASGFPCRASMRLMPSAIAPISSKQWE